jgi:hypothetical protein
MNSAAEAFCILTLAAFGASGLADTPPCGESLYLRAEPSLAAAKSFVSDASNVLSAFRLELNRLCHVFLPDAAYPGPGRKAWPLF